MTDYNDISVALFLLPELLHQFIMSNLCMSCQHKPAVNVTSVCSDTRHDVTKQWRAEALPDAAHWINPPFSDWLDHNVDMSSFSSFEINGSWQNSLGALSPPTGVEFEALTDNGKERK